MRTCCIIAAHNEEKHLADILKKIKDFGMDAIVVDDGSTDNTSGIAENECAHLIRHTANMGKGRSLRDGFRSAVRNGYDFLLTLDADGQHDTSEIPLFIDRLNRSSSGIVVGNRLRRPEGMPLYRLFINRFFSRITALVTRQNIPDPACGYRIIKREVLESISLTADRFDIEYEMIIKAAKAGFKIDSMDIKCVYTGGSSHIKPLQYWNDFFRLIFREMANK